MLQIITYHLQKSVTHMMKAKHTNNCHKYLHSFNHNQRITICTDMQKRVSAIIFLFSNIYISLHNGYTCCILFCIYLFNIYVSDIFT